ncbi:MAG: tetratricopeptide repeat protein [Rhizomicrobium sp.]
MTTAIIVGVLAVGIIIYQEYSGPTIVIQPITVPKDLAEKGFTESVAAQRLRDDINLLYGGSPHNPTHVVPVSFRESRTTALPLPLLKAYIPPSAAKETISVSTEFRTSKILLAADRPQIVIPEVQVSLDTIVSSVLDFFGLSRRVEISGEFVEENNQLILTLRSNRDGLIYQESQKADAPSATPLTSSRAGSTPPAPTPYDPDSLLEPAAEKVLDAGHLSASVAMARWLSGHDDAAFRKANYIILSCHDSQDENVIQARLIQGWVYENNGDYDDAIKSALTVVGVKPQYSLYHSNLFTDGYILLGRALYEHGQYENAVKQFRNAVRWTPEDAGAHIIVAAYGDIGDSEAAIAEYRRVLQIDPHNFEAHRLLYDELRRAGNIYGMRAEYYAVKEFSPTLALVENGDTLNLDGKYGDALFEYNEAIKLDNDNILAYSGIGHVFENAHVFDKAVSVFKKALTLSPKNFSILDDLGDSLLAQSNYGTEQNLANARLAFSRYEQVLAADHTDVHAKIGKILASEEMEQEYDLTKHSDPLFEAWLNSLIKDSYYEILRIDPLNVSALTGLADIYLTNDNYRAEAIIEYLRALAVDPSDRAARDGLGRAYQRLGLYELALKEFDSLVAEDRSDATVFNDRCYTRALQGKRLHDALVDCKIAVSLLPMDNHSRDSQGFLLLRLKNWHDAIVSYDTALQLNAQLAASLFGRGVAELHLGLLKARTDIQKADNDIQLAKKDMQSAKSINASIDDYFAAHGVVYFKTAASVVIGKGCLSLVRLSKLVCVRDA